MRGTCERRGSIARGAGSLHACNIGVEVRVGGRRGIGAVRGV
jgi:hypothetical protein